MERPDVERLRDPGFAIARRGYDPREVDKFLESLVDWLETDAVKELGDIAVTRKLELVGKSTARILLTADQESAKLRRAAEDECEQLLSESEAEAGELRRAAEESARETTDEAHARAKEIVEEGERRRAEIEAVVTELESRRDRTVHELERLRAELGSTIGTHGPVSQPHKDADDVPARVKS